MSIEKKCTVCGNDFTAKNNKAIYCSNSCRVKAYRHREQQAVKRLDNSVYAASDIDNYILQDKIRELGNRISELQRNFEMIVPYIIEAASISKKYSYIEKRAYENTESIDKLEEKTDNKYEKLTLEVDKNQDAINRIFLDMSFSKHDYSGGNNFKDGLGQLLKDEKFVNSISNAISAIAKKEEPKKEEAK